MTDTQRRQTRDLFSDSPPAVALTQCPRCRRRKGVERSHVRCHRCGAVLADEAQWLWAWGWCQSNIGLLRQTVRRVCPSLAADAGELLGVSIGAVLRAVLGWEPAMGVKFSTYAANGVRFAALKAWRLPGDVHPESWDGFSYEDLAVRRPGHTATYRGRRCVLVLRTGERVEGRFVTRTPNKRIVLATATGRRTIGLGEIAAFLSGTNTRDANHAKTAG